MKEIVLSGIRPTGPLHLGNYMGAVTNFVKMQESNKCYFFVADYHSLTTHPLAEHLHENIKQVLAEYLAAGIDPEKSTLYIQSDLPETAELYLFLNMNAYVGELERTTTYKDKKSKQLNNINAGLLTYPTLMAADILIHRATKVPVGKDQEQHLEMARTFGNRFNRMYNYDLFPEPTAYNFGQELVKIPGLDGSGKMGKSEGENNCLLLSDSPEALKKKIMKALTDSGPTQMNQDKPVYIENLFTILKAVGSLDTVQYFEDQWNNCTIKYGDFKKQIFEDVNKFLTPIRERIQDIRANEDYLAKVAKQGAEQARESANATMKEVRRLIGIKSLF
ncbi:MAG: tryptophan--tRNA ligase [Bacteroidales bacterium]|jgi:tryptophanyl-tRNA synthetase|nr:tryptophan--tRNA ligase [Bacteroidales bacterium]